MTTTTGRFSARAWATVAWWSSASGTGVVAEARESMAPGGAPGVESGRFWLAGAASPGAGTASFGHTLNAVVIFWGPPRSPVRVAPHNPGRANATSAAETPREGPL